MTRIKTQIKHDYKKLHKAGVSVPGKKSTSVKPGRWFIVGAVVPITVVAILLWQSQSSTDSHALAQPAASISAAEKIEIPDDPVVKANPDSAPIVSAPVLLTLPEVVSDIIDNPAKEDEETHSRSIVTLKIKSGDTLDELFLKHKLSRGDLGQILKIKEARTALTMLKPGDTIEIAHNDGKVMQLARQLDEVRTLHITPDSEQAVGFRSRVVEKPVEIRMQHAKGTIDNSLFLAARDAGINDTLIMNLAGIFAWDIDFVLDIRQGDSFALVFEEIWQDGHFVRNGEILAAEFNNNGDSFRAIRYADPDGETGYYTPSGHNVKKAFLRAPIAFTPRVTSSFNPKRFHPVHKRVRPHRGVDYGAPTGTPIKAAGDGKVIYRGRKGSYGNTVILQHGGNITTLYAHMSKFNRKVRSGGRVKQGQIIGYVGSTGTVTARHLHYEYRVNGVHRNPRTVKLPQARPIPTKYKADFAAATQPLIKHLDTVLKTQRLASSE